MKDAKVRELAARMNRALETNDVEAFKALFAPGAVVWHNTDRRVVDAVANADSMKILHTLVGDLRIRVVRLVSTLDGFVQQFAMEGTVKSNGSPLEAHNCIVATLEGDRIARIDEYVDGALPAAFQ